jgi:4-hydroxy-tetrahydrodipicolinate reductase
MEKIRVIQQGLGPIGKKILKYMLERKNLEVVGVVDIDKDKIGKDIWEILGGMRKESGLKVTSDLSSLLQNVEADIVVNSTVSSLNFVSRDIITTVESGVNFLSTCEELSFPQLQNLKLAKKIDKIAREKRVSVLGAGVNPGFVMDKLPLVLSSVCKDVKKVKITRIVDASKRRLPLQKKVGAGLSIEEFQKKVKEKKIKHVGLPESLALISKGLNFNLKKIKIKEEIKPVTDKEGKVLGINQLCKGIMNGKEIITLNLQMYLNAKEPRDEIEIFGKPKIKMKVEGGIHGDIATAAIIVNLIPKVVKAKPGLLTVNDIPFSYGILYYNSA